MGILQRSREGFSKIRTHITWNCRLYIYISVVLLLFFDVVARPMWNFILFPWPRLMLSILMVAFMLIEYRRVFPHTLARTRIFIAYVPSLIALYQFIAAASILQTLGQICFLLTSITPTLIDNILAWFLPSLIWIVATSDVVTKIIHGYSTPEGVRKHARKAPWYLPPVFVSCLPAVFPNGFQATSPLPIRELAIYVILALLCFVWFVELPGYYAISRWKRYLYNRLMKLEEAYDQLTRAMNYHVAWRAIGKTGFRIVPNLLSSKITPAEWLDLDEFDETFRIPSAGIEQDSGFHRITNAKELLLVFQSMNKYNPGWLDRTVQHVAILTVGEIIKQNKMEKQELTELLEMGLAKEHSRIREAERKIDPDNEYFFLTAEGIEIGYDILEKISENYEGLRFPPENWREAIIWRLMIELSLPYQEMPPDRTGLPVWVSDFNIHHNAILLGILVNLCAIVETRVQSVFSSEGIDYYGIRYVEAALDYEYIHLDNTIWAKSCPQLSKELQYLLRKFAEQWIGAAIDQRLWSYRYYPFRSVEMPQEGTLANQFDASDYSLTVQLIQKQRRNINDESNHPFPELAALASISGIGTMIAIALRFV